MARGDGGGTRTLSPGPGIFSSAGTKTSTPEGLLGLPGAQLELPTQAGVQCLSPLAHMPQLPHYGTGRTFSVQQGLSFPLGPQHCPTELCLLCPPQVQLALTRFFKEHKSFHVTGADIPSINFTNQFIGFLKTKQCSGGYGQTKQLQRCLDCCSEPRVHSPFGPLSSFPLLVSSPTHAQLCFWVLAAVPMHTQPRECSGQGNTEPLSIRAQFP